MGTTVLLLRALNGARCRRLAPEGTYQPHVPPCPDPLLLRTTLGLTDPDHPGDPRTRTRLTIPQPVITPAHHCSCAPPPPLRAGRFITAGSKPRRPVRPHLAPSLSLACTAPQNSEHNYRHRLLRHLGCNGGRATPCPRLHTRLQIQAEPAVRTGRRGPCRPPSRSPYLGIRPQVSRVFFQHAIRRVGTNEERNVERLLHALASVAAVATSVVVDQDMRRRSQLREPKVPSVAGGDMSTDPGPRR